MNQSTSTRQATSSTTSSTSRSPFSRVKSGFVKVMSVAVITASISYAVAPAASAAARRENVLRGWCSQSRTVECVAYANDDDGVAFVARSGRRYHASSPASALRYLKRHALACKLEDSAHCYWNASSRGNGVGESFMVVGGKAEGTGTVFYLALA